MIYHSGSTRYLRLFWKYPGLDMPFRQLNKNQVRQHFQQAARKYDESAVVQRKSAKRLLEIAASLPATPRVILDIGCGTGHDSQALGRLFPQSTLIPMDISLAMLAKTRARAVAISGKHSLLCADAESLPLGKSSVDLAFSNAAFNWFNDLEATLSNIHAILSAKGQLLFSLFGPGTLKEISDAWEQTGAGGAHVNEFLPSHKLLDMFTGPGFRLLQSETVSYAVYFDSPLQAVKSFRNVGGKNALTQRRKGLTGKNLFARFLRNLGNNRVRKGVPITYEIFIFLLEK